MIDWDGIIERDGPAVWRICWRLLGNRADAEEAFQDTFTAAFELARRQPLATPRAILQHLATARSIDRVRSRQRRRRLLEPARSDDDDRLEQVPVNGTTAAQFAEGEELSEALREALTKLPPKQAEVFVLHAIEGWSYQEICERLSLSVDNVGVLIHRARAKLKVLLAHYAERSGTSASSGKSKPGAGAT